MGIARWPSRRSVPGQKCAVTAPVALPASLLATFWYHIGCPEFRSRKVGLLWIGNALITMAHLIGANPPGALVMGIVPPLDLRLHKEPLGLAGIALLRAPGGIAPAYGFPLAVLLIVNGLGGQFQVFRQSYHPTTFVDNWLPTGLGRSCSASSIWVQGGAC